LGQEDEVRRLIQVERMWVEAPSMVDRMAVVTRTVRYSGFAVNKISVLLPKRTGARHLRLYINPLNPELNPICYLLALLGAHHFLHVSRIRVKLLTLRRLMSYIYGAPILDVSRSHTTTQHSR